MVRPDEILNLRLGDTLVPLQVWRSARPRWRLLHLHANEQTARRAALSLLRRREIELRSLVHDQGRRLRFEVSGTYWTLDPNRCFSRSGALSDLHQAAGREPPAEVVEAAVGFGESLFAAGAAGVGAVVVLHNNTNDGTFTIGSFLPGGECAADAARAQRASDQDPDDFFLVTRPVEYELLAEMGWNVVLQSPDGADDGSLSVRCARQGLPYINIEAQHARRGHEEANSAMIVDALYVLQLTCP